VIAYVMAHLDLSLVESYLLVRSRRLNIVIQPHLLFIWELRGWETYLNKAKHNQARMLQSRDHPGHEHQLSFESWFALARMTGRGCSDRSDAVSDTFETARSSPLGSPVSSSAAVDDHALPASNLPDEDLLLDIEIGAGAGSAHGLELRNSATLPFGSGSPDSLPYSSTRLTWGYLTKEIADLNARYSI
jgi:dual specificity MAP kinase phosphatase